MRVYPIHQRNILGSSPEPTLYAMLSIQASYLCPERPCLQNLLRYANQDQKWAYRLMI